MLQFFPEHPFSKSGDILLSISMEGCDPALEDSSRASNLRTTTTKTPTMTTTTTSAAPVETTVGPSSAISPASPVKFNPENQTGPEFLNMVKSIIQERSRQPENTGIIVLLNTTNLHRFNVMPRIWREGDTLETTEARAVKISEQYWEAWQEQNKEAIDLLKEFARKQGRESEWVLHWQNIVTEPAFRTCLNKVQNWPNAKGDPTKFRKNLAVMNRRFSKKLQNDNPSVEEKISHGIIGWQNINACFGEYALEECAVHIFLRGGTKKKFSSEVYRGLMGTPMYIARERISEVYPGVSLSNAPENPANDLVDMGSEEELRGRATKRANLLAAVPKHQELLGRKSPPSSGISSGGSGSGERGSPVSSVKSEPSDGEDPEALSQSSVKTVVSEKPRSKPELERGTSNSSSLVAKGSSFFGAFPTTPPVAAFCPPNGGGVFYFFNTETAVEAARVMSQPPSPKKNPSTTTQQRISKSQSPPTSPAEELQGNSLNRIPRPTSS